MRPFCKTCATKYGKELWQDSCCCTGHVSIGSKPPGRSKFPDFTPKKQVEEVKETGPKISAKERARLDRAMGKLL